jgi:hypothetical protein
MRFWRDNGLSLVLIGAFLLCLVGMTLAGWLQHNEELIAHNQPPLALMAYFVSSDFQSALFENWESEFLQMSAYVILTAMLFQRGSAESKDPDGDNEVDQDPALLSDDPQAPRAAKAKGLLLWLYSYSLGIALAALFLLSFVLHFFHSLAAASETALVHGEPVPSALEYLLSARLWFESFQNWQSEFLATAVIVILSIMLRYRGSPESKPVAAPHSQTGA